MRIFDENNVELESPDLSKGYLVDDKILITHHEAVEGIDEKGHYETIKEYPDGGRDVKWIVDVPAVEAREAWDEYEDIQRYILYTDAELAKLSESQKTVWDRMAEAIREGVNSI